MKEVFQEDHHEKESIFTCGNCGAPLPEASTQRPNTETGSIHIVCEQCGYIQTIHPVA